MFLFKLLQTGKLLHKLRPNMYLLKLVQSNTLPGKLLYKLIPDNSVKTVSFSTDCLANSSTSCYYIACCFTSGCYLACCWMEFVSLAAEMILVTQISTRLWSLWEPKKSGALDIA